MGVWLSGSEDQTVRLWQLTHERVSFPLRLSQVRSQEAVLHAQTQAIALFQQAEHAFEEARFAAALDLVGRGRAIPGWERSPRSWEVWTKLLHYCSKVRCSTGWLISTFAQTDETDLKDIYSIATKMAEGEDLQRYAEFLSH